MPVPIKNNSKEEETCKSVRDLRASIPYSVYSPKQFLLCLFYHYTSLFVAIPPKLNTGVIFKLPCDSFRNNVPGSLQKHTTLTTTSEWQQANQ